MKNENKKNMLEKANPPVNDEPWTEEDETAWQEGLKDIAESRFQNLEDVALELQPISALLEVARAVEEDSVAISLIMDVVKLSAKYVQAVIAHEGARRLDVYAMEPEEFRKHMSELDALRHAVHNALIAKVTALNRLCTSEGFDLIYTGDINDRAAVGDFALKIVDGMFQLRVK